jgi:hypothetical protein
LSRMNLPSRNSPCCITAMAASRPLNDVPIMPTRQGECGRPSDRTTGLGRTCAWLRPRLARRGRWR